MPKKRTTRSVNTLDRKFLKGVGDAGARAIHDTISRGIKAGLSRTEINKNAKRRADIATAAKHSRNIKEHITNLDNKENKARASKARASMKVGGKLKATFKTSPVRKKKK